MNWEITGDERLAACLEKMPTGQLEEAVAAAQLLLRRSNEGVVRLLPRETVWRNEAPFSAICGNLPSMGMRKSPD
ncbi:hypothetical protein [Nonomuraea sp. NPDC050310]|uniref:hypothetical protein n=1 Tax=Nonomuraea sp. NPDC050310 TaxID=3154935 RepID=UPI0033E65BDB